MWILALVALVLRSGTMIVPFLTVYLTIELRFSMAEAGICMSFFGLGSVAGAFAGGKLTDRYGAYYVQLLALLGGGLMIWLLRAADTVWLFSLVAFWLSAIADSFRPAIMAAVKQFSSQENLTRSMSLIRLAINLGFAVGPSLGGLLAQSYGFGVLFWGNGAACMAAAVIFGSSIPHSSPQKPKSESTKATKSQYSPYADGNFLVFLALLVLSMMAFMQLLSSFPLFLKNELNFSESKIGALMAMNGLLIALLEMPIVFSFEKRFNTLILVSIGTALIAVSYLVLLLHSVRAAVVCMLLLTIGEILQFPFSNSYVAQKSGDSPGEYMGLYFVAIAVAQILSPFAGLWLAENYGFTILWLSICCMGLVSAAGFLVLKKFSAKKIP